MKLTIVMYHYVRDLANTRFPEIKGLRTDLFIEQLDYLARHYEFVTMEQTLEVLHQGGARFPPNGVLLTFDDGYSDHFDVVFPILANRGIQGSFFPPSQAILEHRVLDVNKIHFILASSSRPSDLVRHVFEELDRCRSSFGLEPNDYYYKKLATPSRFDPEEVIFVKRLLQRELPPEARRLIVDALFESYVGVPQCVFARELYMSVEQIRCMKNHGMFIGSHGFEHIWLNSVPQSVMEQDIDRSLDFLERIGASRQDWVMCYPYGAHNAQVREALRKRNCRAALTTEVGVADLNPENALTLGRLDTNDLPKEACAKPNDWTRQILTSEK